MSFIYQQINSFLNLGVCKEYPIMARSKSPTGSKQKNAVANPAANNVPTGTPAEPRAASTQTEAARPETRKLGVVKNDSRPHVVPINLDDEIRRRAYELAEQRGFSAGHETEDWLIAEREILQRYREQSA
jgi:Protein of unknown function (DUF2934)